MPIFILDIRLKNKQRQNDKATILRIMLIILILILTIIKHQNIFKF